MKVTIELTDEDIAVMKEHQIFKMQWIKAGMEEKTQFDVVVQKVLNAAMTTKLSSSE